MAKFSNVNTTPATGAVAIFNFKAVLKSAGWTVPSSSDGTTYNAAGDQITGGGAGANGMANNSAWFRIQDPGGVREFTFQRNAAGVNTTWRVKYSAVSKFTGGAPAAAVTPSAADEQILIGAGSDAAPTFAALFAADGGYKHHSIAQGAAVGGVYGFWSFANTNGAATITSALFCDPIDTTSVSALDQDPCVVACYQATWSNLQFATKVFGWYKKGLAGVTWVAHHAFGLKDNAGNVGAPGSFGTNAYDGNDNAFPIVWGRCANDATQVGCKGFSKYMKFKFGAHVYPDSINLAADAYAYVDDCLVPWPNGVAPAT